MPYRVENVDGLACYRSLATHKFMNELPQSDGSSKFELSDSGYLQKLLSNTPVGATYYDDDSPEKVALVHSVGASLSEFPVTLEAATSAHMHGMQVIMGAPNALRGSSHSGNLSALEALEHGVLNALASDYYPAAMLRAALCNC